MILPRTKNQVLLFLKEECIIVSYQEIRGKAIIDEEV